MITDINIKWSEEKEPNNNIRYNHITASTPIGKFIMTWKSWKTPICIDFDEVPWESCWHSGWYESWASIADAKKDAEKELMRRINLMVNK